MRPESPSEGTNLAEMRKRGESDMADSRAGRVLGHLHHLLSPTATRTGDGMLLERFVRQRDEEAFAELVSRHGPLVFGLCRRLLGNVQDAEDVFQATFLVLARKAATIRKPGALSSFLHGVAYRLARKAKAEANKRRIHEQQAAPPANSAETDLSWREVRGVLDEELQRLPEKQRLPLVLCYLEGLTQDEASRHLGWPRGTLKRRLEAGRERLRLRLTQRGVTLGAGLFAIALTESATKGAVPAILRSVTVRTSMQFVNYETPAIAATPAVLLAQGALQTMLTTKLKLGAMMILLLGCVVTAAGLALPQVAPKNQLKSKAEAPPSVPPAKDEQVRKDRYGDPLPPGALARLGTLRMRHSNHTAEAVFTPDGKTVIVSDWGGEIIFWDVATGRELRRLWAADGPVNGLALALSSDGKTLVAGGFGRFSLWDVATGKKLSQIEVPVGNIWQLLLTPDGKTLALHDEKSILLWDIAGNKMLHELKEHKGPVARLALSPDGKTLAWGTWKDGHVHLWDIASAKEKSLISAGDNGVVYVAFSPDGKTLATAGNPLRGVRLWDVATGKKLREVPGWPLLFAFFSDGKTIAGLESDRKVHIYDAVNGKHLRQYESPSANTGLSSGQAQMMARLAISPDGKTAASLGGKLTFDLSDPVRGKLLHSSAGHRDGIAAVAFAIDGKSLFSVSDDPDYVLVWDAATGELRDKIGEGYNGISKTLALAPDGKQLATGMRKLILWEALTGKEVRRCAGPEDIIVSAAWSADGKTLVSCSQNGTIRVWDPATGKQRRAIEPKPRAPQLPIRIAVSPDGAIVAAYRTYGQGPIFLWETDTGKELRPIAAPQGIISALAFRPDKSILASAGSEGGICLWEPTTGQLLRRWDTPPGQIRSLAFSRDGRTLASGHSDSSLRLWETASGKQRASFTGHRGGIGAVTLSRDGRRIASGSWDTTILIWDATGGAHRDVALSPEQLQMVWRDLGDADAGRAYRALWQLALSPKQALPFLAKCLRPLAPLEEPQQKQVNRFMADLDSDQFAVRQQAESELEKMGLLIEPVLRKALECKPSLEVRQRIEAVLAKLASERLRITRALEAIEHMNTRGVRRILEELSEGAPHAWLTEEARAIRNRLAE